MPSFDIYKRWARSALATELYITAIPKSCVCTHKDIAEILVAVKETLQSTQASIFQERIFTTQQAVETVQQAYQEVFGNNDNDVKPSILIGKPGQTGILSGIQVHAIIGPVRPETLKLNGLACGRILKLQGQNYVNLSGLSGGTTDSRSEQARKMLEKAESVLKQFGKDFMCVPRTWMWLGDILSWYGEFNAVRNKFFSERGLIGKGSRQSMPASTGIGLALAGAGYCGMDLTAVLEPANSIEFLAATGRQQCALEYGSAFSRASQAPSPAGKTVFVSGTASINAEGATTHIGNIDGQIQTTIENVRAVLKDTKCSDKDVVQGVVYCKNKEVEKEFENFKKKADWPMPVVICDICRDDLLFEIEATAIPGAKS